MGSLFARKSLASLREEAGDAGDHTLKRVLTASNLIMLGIGGIIGTGIFVLTGQAAAAYAGPAVLISFVLAGLVSVLAAFCYTEFAASVPVSGSAYTYAYASLGEFFAWLIGWDLVLEYALGAATVAVGWSGYFVHALAGFGWALPVELTAATGTPIVQPDGTTVTAWLNLPAVLVIWAVTFMLIRGIKESAWLNELVVWLKLAVVVAVVLAGVWFVDLDHLHPFIPENLGEFGQFGWSGIARGASVIFFAYLGFDAISTAAQEVKNPQRDMPIGILGSLFVCTVLYVAVAFVMVGLVPYTQLGGPAPMAVAIDAAAQAAQSTAISPLVACLPALVKIGALAGLSSVLVVLLLAQPRVLFAMAKDGLLPSWASRVHPRYRTPYLTSLATAAVVSVAAGATPIGVLGEMVSIGTLFAFVVVALGILVSRKIHPELLRPFRTPGVPWLPAISAVISTSLMLTLPLATQLRLLAWMALGVVIYFAYGRRHSRLQREPSPSSR